MTRSSSVRGEVLELDGHRCQICGYDGRDEQFRPWVVPHHGVQTGKLGMGGSAERDTVENAVTLCSTVDGLGLPPNRGSFFGLANEGSCHRLVEDGLVHILNWDPEQRTFDVTDTENRRVDPARLWCHRRRQAEELEMIEGALHGVHKADGQVAYGLWRLWKGDAFKALDPDAKSFRAFCEARDWRTSSCVEMAETYELSKEGGLEWVPGEMMRAFKKRAKDAGLIAPRSYFYVRLPEEIYYRTADEEGLREQMPMGCRLLKIGKTVWGLRANGGRLLDPNDEEINVVCVTPNGDS